MRLKPWVFSEIIWIKFPVVLYLVDDSLFVTPSFTALLVACISGRCIEESFFIFDLVLIYSSRSRWHVVDETNDFVNDGDNTNSKGCKIFTSILFLSSGFRCIRSKSKRPRKIIGSQQRVCKYQDLTDV